MEKRGLITPRTLLAAAALAACAPAQAAINCLMPNGKTITLRSATQCPADAAQVDERGKVLHPPRATPAAPPPKAPAARAAPAAPAPAPARPAGPDALTVAQATCDILRSRGAASECKVNVGWLGHNHIDITTNDPPRTAWSSCVTLADGLRQQAPDFRGQRTWTIRLYSPFSGSRPIASCDI